MPPLPRSIRSARSTRTDVVFVVLVVVGSVVARFLTRSPLWLDEALSVNIAGSGGGSIVDALRHDGHPPLYYALLRAWMELVGSSDFAVRLLSGLCATAALPLAYAIGRRRAGQLGGALALLVTAVAPWNVRYATEARMYALVALLVLCGWVLADDLLVAASRWRWVALVLVTGAALLTHYWVIPLGVAAVAVLAWRWRYADPDGRPGARRVLGALACGAAAFLPWLPVFFHQVAHTGTPWATAGRPTSALMELVRGIGGGEFAEAVLVGVFVLVLVFVGLVGRTGDRVLVLDPGTVPGVRGEIAVGVGTFLVGLAIGLVTDAVFTARYAATFLPLLLVAAGVGLARLPPTWRRGGAVAVVGLALPGIGASVIDSRTQGREFAETIDAAAQPGDVIAMCPDQLGPATLRELRSTVPVLGLPSFERPERIDWVDYAARNAAADPLEAVERLDAAAGTVWLVLSPDYRTYEGYCDTVFRELQIRRPGAEVAVPDRDGEVFEAGSLIRYPPVR